MQVFFDDLALPNLAISTASLEEAVSFEGDQVMMDGGRGSQPDGICDLAHRRRVPPLCHGAGDALEDLLAAIDVVPGQAMAPSAVGGLAGP